MDRFGPYAKALRALEDDNRLRGLNPRAGIDFSSNDYLAVANASRMKRAALAADERGTPLWFRRFAAFARQLRGARLPRGRRRSVLRHRDSAVLPSCYVANFTIPTTLPQRGDLLVLVSPVHASIHEGARAGRAEFRMAGHNDPGAIESAIRDWRRHGGMGRIWIVVKSLYSMDGDFAPLREFVALADRFDASLVVDEAHATGVYGAQGRGLSSITIAARISWLCIPAARRSE
ncbi:aminotransferase class I/II-fold pyridoxal phosphate-dependent enzyme [Bradyrhizobium sp. Arg816]|uniref:aminotransferase class I/II-fold pyridoxal phosphate-dependent enzyme n=1 Tax=Bradyrhizobium sp. Arg816 TaxID=2998491 RepID=UPI0034D48037